jgi:Fe-S-cluster-containing hydrogenase component 2
MSKRTDIPSCVEKCANKDLKQVAERAFQRGSMSERNAAAKACLMHGRREQRDEDGHSEERVLQMMRFIRGVFL